MKIQYVSIKPTQRAEDLGCYSFIPEMLASVGARYSRSNLGLEGIVNKLDPNNQDKSIDTIFKFLDYGHGSLADLAPIALFIDDITQYAAYYLWTLAPTAGGQECSTRYIKLDSNNVASADDLGIDDNHKEDFNSYISKSFAYYEEALKLWTKIGENNPEVTKIPSSLLNSSSEKDKKQVARMMRNYAFDRARVYLPVSALTGVMMIQSARAWANISAHLQSHSLKELNDIGKEIQDKLSIGAPRLLKHCRPTESIKKYINFERDIVLECADQINILADNETRNYLETEDLLYEESLIKRACEFRTNRYSPFGCPISRMSVKFAWEGISFGEIRDLNRHRTGNKYCPLFPLSFYGSTDQFPDNANPMLLDRLNVMFAEYKQSTIKARELFKQFPEYIYFTSLGHTYYFEHTTTADKFIYEMELRTGIGAHFKYAEHCREILKLWYDKYPELEGVIFEGSAEPE